MANSGIKNLRPIRDTATAKERGKLGGIASGEAKREKKKMSEIYQAFIDSPEGKELIDKAIKKGLVGKNPTSGLKELREGTEGTKSEITGADGLPFAIEININGHKAPDKH